MKLVFYYLMLMLGCVQIAKCEPAETTPISLDAARQYFEEIKAISDYDAGKLWGVPLYGPTLFVDPSTRFIVANQMDREGRLSADRGVYTGTLESATNIANTSVSWSGTKWTMVNWNAVSASNPKDRARLLFHESWHRVQEELGIPSATTSNFYLDELDGRVGLLLEFRALNRALIAEELSAQKEAIVDALTLRYYRQSQHPDNNENAFEKHEGLAEYTGLKLCGLADSLITKVVAKKLQLGESNDGLANSFAYLTGPALGFLLDRHSASWRDSVRSGRDLPTLLASAIGWQAPVDKEQLQTIAELAGQSYGSVELIANETARSKAQEATVESFRNRLATHGRLMLQNDNLNFSFDPMEKLIAFDTTGVIYKTMRITGNFGVLEVTDGIIRTSNWQYFIAVAPKDINGDKLTWEGYTLQLQIGWVVEAVGENVFAIVNKN